MINKIYLGKQEKLFKRISDESIDVVFADPPFNLNKKYNSYNDNMTQEEYIKWCNKWLKEIVRVVKPTGSIFIHNIPKWAIYHASFLNNLCDFKNWISWKTTSSPPHKTCLFPNHYSILYYAKNKNKQKFYAIRKPHDRCRKCNFLLKDYGGKKHLLNQFGPMIGDVWTDIFRVRHKKKRSKHPCELPVHLIERILLMSTDEGDIILDPFMGTGTTAVASKKLGRKFIGFEKDEKYYDIILDRLKNIKSNSKIGEYWVSWYLDNIITLREKDWDGISKYYIKPDNPKKIDKEPMVLLDKNLRGQMIF